MGFETCNILNKRRIISAGYRRKGKKLFESENNLLRWVFWESKGCKRLSPLSQRIGFEKRNGESHHFAQQSQHQFFQGRRSGIYQVFRLADIFRVWRDIQKYHLQRLVLFRSMDFRNIGATRTFILYVPGFPSINSKAQAAEKSLSLAGKINLADVVDVFNITETVEQPARFLLAQTIGQLHIFLAQIV